MVPDADGPGDLLPGHPLWWQLRVDRPGQLHAVGLERARRTERLGLVALGTAGFEAELFFGDFFTGGSITLDANEPNFVPLGLNDTMSSLTVREL